MLTFAESMRQLMVSVPEDRMKLYSGAVVLSWCFWWHFQLYGTEYVNFVKFRKLLGK